MPAGTTTIHALLQIVTVALGSPLGREVAPREMGALGAGMVARKLGLMADETRTLVACGATVRAWRRCITFRWPVRYSALR